MKKTVIILSVLALSINSYGQNWADSIFYSSIRPNEELKLNTLYTDTVEYRGDYEDLLMLIQKDAETTGAFFCDGICEIASDLNLNPGDIVEIQWEIDSFRYEVDKELLLFGEFVIEITKIKVSVLPLSINSYGQNWADSIFYSSIRPNEELKLNTLYTDTVEYRGDYEDLLMLIQKDAETTGAFFCDGICKIASDLNLNPGDIVEIQWKIDSFRNEVDKELLLFGEYVIEITKIKDGI